MRKHIKNLIESKIIALLSLIIVTIIVPLNFYIVKEEFHYSANINIEKLSRNIVVFKDEFKNDIAKDNIIKLYGGNKLKNLDIVNGKVIYISESSKYDLLRDKNVLKIEDDTVFKISGKPSLNQQGQIVPWGIEKIKADQAWINTTGIGVKIAVIDTGIESNHPDLLGRVKGGYNAINNLKSAIDDNGHGTHVAGIIGAINNSFGTVGVGPDINLYSVKSLNKTGNGYLSDIIEGIEWSIKNKMQIINMSFGSNTNSSLLQNAIKKAYDSGIIMIAAAGNDGGNVNFPASYNEVISVSALDENLQIAEFSNRGPEIDISAPGVNIFSTYKGQTYKILNGTSMSAPFVSGVIGLIISKPIGNYDKNLNNIWDPLEVESKLKETSTDLGSPGLDEIYGYGLLNAKNAIE